MTFDPLSLVSDLPVRITADTIDALREFRQREKVPLLPGIDFGAERSRLAGRLDDLADRLIQGVASNPTKRWVLAQFVLELEKMNHEDTEAREHFGMELEAIMEMLSIESSDGVLSFYL